MTARKKVPAITDPFRATGAALKAAAAAGDEAATAELARRAGNRAAKAAK